MVQLKYFGDSRDYFKYDLITYLLRERLCANYAFIPMLTNHRVDGEGNKTPKYIEGKSRELLSFIFRCELKDLNHWEQWLEPLVDSYVTLAPVNEIFFADQSRREYWGTFEEISKIGNALIFVDPDTGLETGNAYYLKKMGREKYILNSELSQLFERLEHGSVLMLYQHLTNNKHIHKESVDKKLVQASIHTGSQYVLAYREDDLAFLFLLKSKQLFNQLYSMLNKYYQNSDHTYKSLHNISNALAGEV